MGIRPGGGYGYRKPIGRGQPKKPFLPVEEPFPSKGEFRLGVYKVLEEKDDYLKCLGFDPLAKNPFSEITPSAFRTIKVAKPPLLLKSPWDGKTVDIDGTDYTYEYTGVGVRTVTWTDSDGFDQEVEERITPPYFDDDILVAIEVRKTLVQTGFVVNDEKVEDENDAPLHWVDLNVSGRHWAGDTGTLKIGKTDASATAGSNVTVSVWTGDADSLSDSGDNVTARTLAYALDSDIFVKLTPFSSIAGVNAIAGADYLAEPLECNA